MGEPNGDASGEEGIRRRSCGCSKQDFLPEESFKSWGNYTKALKATPARLLDRLTARSGEHIELVEMKARSQNEMKKSLRNTPAQLSSCLMSSPVSPPCFQSSVTLNLPWRSQQLVHAFFYLVYVCRQNIIYFIIYF